jgi:uncharacterized protein (TIGR03066 family)
MPALRLLACLGLCLLAFGAASAQEKPADLLVGKWEFKGQAGAKDGGFFLTFEKLGETKEGKLKLEVGGTIIEGTYRLPSDTEMEVTMKIGNDIQRQKLKFTVTKEKLETTDEQQKKEEFTKAK